MKKLPNELLTKGFLPNTIAEKLAQDLKIFKMGLLGIPQERIAQRLGIPQQRVADHLPKNSGLKKSVNELLRKGFSVNTIAEKLG